MGKKILCIDDSINLLQVLKKRFELEFPGITVITCDNGTVGLRLAQQELPSVIILDINMPGMNGDEVLRSLRHPEQAHLGTRTIPVIMLTSHGPEKRAQYLALGATDYVSSPFDTNELVAKVKTLLG